MAWDTRRSVVGLVFYTAACALTACDDGGGETDDDGGQIEDDGSAGDASASGDASATGDSGPPDSGTWPDADAAADGGFEADAELDGALAMDAAVDASEPDAGLDAAVDAGSSDAADAGGDAQAGEAGPDGSLPDAGDGSVSAPSDYTCHVTGGEGFPDDVIFATGVGGPRWLVGDRLLIGQDDATINVDISPKMGRWAIWDTSTAKLVQSSDVDASLAGNIWDVGGDSFLTRTTNGYAYRALNNGVAHWTKAGCPPRAGGVASDGSYAWTLCGSLIPASLEARAPVGAAWLNVQLTSDPRTLFGTADALTVVYSTSNETTLVHYARAGGAPTTVGPFSGQFLGVFEDRTHVVTKAAGNIIRVYDLAGVRKALLDNVAGDFAGGRAGVFWIGVRDPKTLKFYRLEDTPTPLTTVASVQRVDVLHDGLALTRAAAQWDRIVIDGNNVQVSTQTSVDGAAVNAVASAPGRVAYGEGKQTTDGVSVVTGAPKKLGCGPAVRRVGDATRVFVGTAHAGTFVYQAPFETPIGTIPVNPMDIRVSRASGRVALLTADKIYVYGADLSLLMQLPAQPRMQIELSPDGTRLSTAFTYRTQAFEYFDRVEIIGVPSGASLYFNERTSPNGPLGVVGPPVLSPSSARWVDNVSTTLARIYEGTTLLGTFEGGATEWLSEDRIAARIFNMVNPGTSTGESVMNQEGVRQGVFECVATTPSLPPFSPPLPGEFWPWSMDSQWPDATHVYAVSGNLNVCDSCLCDLPSGTPHQVRNAAPYSDGPFPFAIFGTFGVHPNGRGVTSVVRKLPL